MGQRIAGIAYIRVDGRQWAARGNWTVSQAPSERQGIAGQDYVHGFSELPRVPFIEGDISTTAEFSVEELHGISDATVQCDLANGKSYVLRNAWQAGSIDINTHDGSAKVKFEGLDCIEFA